MQVSELLALLLFWLYIYIDIDTIRGLKAFKLGCVHFAHASWTYSVDSVCFRSPGLTLAASRRAGSLETGKPGAGSFAFVGFGWGNSLLGAVDPPAKVELFAGCKEV